MSSEDARSEHMGISGKVGLSGQVLGVTVSGKYNRDSLDNKGASFFLYA